LDRCPHSVYVVPADWQSQARAGIPPSRRIAWYCWICRDYEAYGFSLERLLDLARANCDGKASWPIRKTAVLITSADYDLPDDAEDDVDLDVAA